MTRSLVAILTLLLLAGPATARAQQAAFPTSPRFVDIIKLAQDGRSDSARALIGKIIDDTPEGDPSYPEALYTAATIAASGSDARLLFSRVAVEYSQSPWADKALLRLAQLDYGTGDTEGAVNRIRRLMLDYPTSSVMASAALWGARAAFEQREYAVGCPWITKGLESVGDNVEVRNQLEFMKRRCTAAVLEAAPATADTAVRTTPVPVLKTPERRPIDTAEVKAPPAPGTPEQRPVDTTEVQPPPAVTPTPPPAPAPVAKAPESPWRVQVAALSDPVAMRRVEGIIRKLGLTPYREPGPNGLTKVQAGPFATRAAANARLAELTRAIGGKPYVTQAP